MTQFNWRAFVLPAALLALAEIAYALAPVDSDSLAPPSAIIKALSGAFSDGDLLHATRDTLTSAIAGLALGGGLGLAFGIVLGLVPIIDRLMEFTIEALRPIPSIALIPIALTALGFGYRLEISIIAFATFWSLLILSRAAIAGIEPRLIEVARVLRLRPRDIVFKIVLPASAGRIFVAFRLAAGVALIVAVTVEIAVNPQGLGHAIMTAQQALQPALMLAYLIWIGLIGFALNRSLIVLEAWLFGAPA